ncbi:MAG TPA: OmpH family outer membrane protein [Firmicutes bacterium]|nr:OmpH family outer membrane protein [Bacillota bacterium]
MSGGLFRKMRGREFMQVIRRLAVPGLLIGGAVVLLVAASSMGVLRAAPSGEDIGFVDMTRIEKEYPDVQKALSSIQQEYQKLQKELDEKAKGLDDAAKKKLLDEYQKKLDQRKVELWGPVDNRIKGAIRDVAKEQGLNLMLRSEVVLHGGKDVTDAVLKKLNAASNAAGNASGKK